TLLTTAVGTHDIEVVGRTANGGWWASGYDFSQDPSVQGTVENAAFAVWSADVDWQHVRFGDYDGDGLKDVAGFDPSTGYWWTTLSDMIGSTTVVGTRWSTATTWTDVGVVDLAPGGDRGDQGHFTNKSDLVGRSADGGWWAAVANGDGTFTNAFLGHWSPNAGWRDTQFLDINNDGATDIVSRNAAGGWWGLVSRGAVIAYDTVRLGGWSPTAGWQDTLVAQNFFRDGDDAILGRASDGAWWALDFAADGSATNRYVTSWNEAADWTNVVAADLDGDGRDEVVGQTADGEWWRIVAATAPSEFIGWEPPANNVRVSHDVTNALYVTHRAFDAVVDAILSRDDSGYWWASVLAPDTKQFQRTLVGAWDESAGWRDVAAARVSRVPVWEVQTGTLHTVKIFGHRAGTTVTVEGRVDWLPVSGAMHTVTVHYAVPTTGFSRDYTFTAFPGKVSFASWQFEFTGHIGNDDYRPITALGPSIAHGNAGNDTLDGRNNGSMDQLFGGDGLDVLLGDPEDVLVQ
ncbi:MAG: hypothetical protein M3552_20085, partial [Planctomycetota bacterium]|nr:hypothetical protein [Planctomycetota bacterium]